MTIQELEIYKEKLEGIYKFKQAFLPSIDAGIRNLYKIAEVIYPQIDDFIFSHYPSHRDLRGEKTLEFCIKIPDYFYNMYTICEDKFDKDYKDILDILIWDQPGYELGILIEDYFPEDENRNYTVAGRSGGWLLIEHRFNYYPALVSSREIRWDQLERKDKLNFLHEYIRLEEMVEDINELYIWYKFDNDLTELRKITESEEYAKDMFDFIREDYEHWVEENVDKFNSLLCSIKNEREDEAIKERMVR